MSTQPLVSVCIPCYNGAEFLPRTLQSVLNQTFTNFEVVIADNHSTDGTVPIIQSFADSRIRLIRNGSNLGMIANLQKVLSCATGKYVKLLCADDLLHTECLSRQVSVLQNPSNSSAVLAICNRNVIDAQDRVVLRRRFPFPAGLQKGERLVRSCVRWGTNVLGEPAVALFGRGGLARIGTLDSSNPYFIDLNIWAELLKQGNAFIDPDYLAAFRISNRGASATIGRHQAAYFRRFVRTIRNDPSYRVTPVDVMLGYALSLLWCALRNIFIRLHPKLGAVKVGVV